MNAPRPVGYQVYYVHPLTGEWTAYDYVRRTKRAAQTLACQAHRVSENGRVEVRPVYRPSEVAR